MTVVTMDDEQCLALQNAAHAYALAHKAVIEAHEFAQVSEFENFDKAVFAYHARIADRFKAQERLLAEAARLA